jgi:hypothetical protein
MARRSAERATQEAFAEGFRAGLLRAEQARNAKQSSKLTPRAALAEPLARTLTIHPHSAESDGGATGAPLMIDADPTRLSNLDVVLRAAALAGEALAWAVADECARSPALPLPAADVPSCVAHALKHLSAYERCGARRAPPTSVPAAELRAGLVWLASVHTDMARPSYARFYALPDSEVDAALGSAGALVRAFTTAGSGIRRNLQAVQFHARMLRRDAIEARATPAPAPLADGAGLAAPRTIEGLEAAVEALLGRAATAHAAIAPAAVPPPPPPPQPAAAAAAATAQAGAPVISQAVPSTLPTAAPPAHESLQEAAARVRALAAQRAAALAAELVAAADADYVAAATRKLEVAELDEAYEEARVRAEGRARVAREQAAAAVSLLAAAAELETRATLNRDYARGAARAAKARYALEEALPRLRDAPDMLAQRPPPLASAALVSAAARSVDVRWPAALDDDGARPRLPSVPALRYECTRAYVVRWARDDTVEVRRPRVVPATPPSAPPRVAPAGAGAPPPPPAAAPPPPAAAQGGAPPPAADSASADAQRLWASLCALAPGLLQPAVRFVVVRGSALSLLALGGPPPAAGEPVALRLAWRGPSVAAARAGASRAPTLVAHTLAVAADVATARALGARLAAARSAPADAAGADGACAEEHGGGEWLFDAAELPLVIERDGVPVPNAALPVAAPPPLTPPLPTPPAPADATPAGAKGATAPVSVTGAATPAKGAATATGAESQLVAAALASSAVLDAFRYARLSPLEPGVAYRLRVLAVSSVGLRGPSSVELHFATAPA